MALDPDANFSTIQARQVRIRNKRGEYQYQSIDHTGNNSLKGDLTGRTGSYTPQGNLTLLPPIDRDPIAQSDITKAENRLRVIEQISLYREEKIKREFLKLENELREEEEKNRKKQIKEQQMAKYFSEQKERIFEYQKMKAFRLQEQE